MASSSVSLSLADTLASCQLITQRIQEALSTHEELILRRSEWQCLAVSYSDVVQALPHLLQLATGQHDFKSSQSLSVALHILRDAILEGERRLGDCIARLSSPFSQSWLLDMALKLGACTDVVDVHLQRFLWAFSTVLDTQLSIMPPNDNVKEELVRLTRKLSDNWASASAKDDLSSLCNFLAAVRCKEKGEISSLADFILQKLSYALELEAVMPDTLPAYLWVDPESLQRNPDILGSGGYGNVFEAVWLGGHFAVKDFFYVESNKAFGREAVIQARLRHPNVIPLVCCTKKPSLQKCSLVMELMEKDLRVWMLERLEAGICPPFSLGVAVELMLQIAQGMEYLHSLHIMHRDLKSSNILVNFSTRPSDSDSDVCLSAHLKIADFGMSKAKQASSRYTTRHVGATPWRAPEVFNIDPEDEVEGMTNLKYTKKADVYSFGLVCYEILTGKPPFEGCQVKRRVLAGERPTLPSYCPQALSSYIQCCWNTEPAKRPPFSQICRVLRFIKTAVFHQNQHCETLESYSWLSRPLSDGVCARIDDMFGSFLEHRDILFLPLPLNNTLEMYCFRVVLQQEVGWLSIFNNHTDSNIHAIVTQASFDSDVFLKETDEMSFRPEQGLRESAVRAKNPVAQWLRMLFCMPGSHVAKSELQDTFTWNELRIATADFSKMIGQGVYYGRLDDGREIAVKVRKNHYLIINLRGSRYSREVSEPTQPSPSKLCNHRDFLVKKIH